IVLAAALALGSPAQTAGSATATLKDASGNEVGKTALKETPSGVLVRLDLTGLAAGEHALHFMPSANASRRTSNRPVPISIPASTSTGSRTPKGLMPATCRTSMCRA